MYLQILYIYALVYLKIDRKGAYFCHHSGAFCLVWHWLFDIMLGRVFVYQEIRIASGPTYPFQTFSECSTITWAKRYNVIFWTSSTNVGYMSVRKTFINNYLIISCLTIGMCVYTRSLILWHVVIHTYVDRLLRTETKSLTHKQTLY